MSIEHIHKKGFFKHPDYDDLYVSRFGLVYDSERDVVLEATGCSNKYLNLDIPGYKRLYIHRLVAETFIPKPVTDDNVKFIVNHKNGIKNDNFCDNLEWTTYSGNILHAYQTGLREDNLPVLMLDLSTRKTERFYGLQACARALNINAEKVHTYLKNRYERKPLLNRYILTFERTEWPDENYVKEIDADKGTFKKIVITDKNSGSVVVAEGISKAAEYIKINYSALAMSLHRSRKKNITPITIKNFDVCYFCDYKEPIPDGTMLIENDNQKGCFVKGHSLKREKKVRVIDLVDGSVEFYDGMSLLAKDKKTSKSAMQKNVWRNNGVWKKRFKVEYTNA